MTAVLVTSTALILALTALRALLGGRVSPRLRYALWLLAALRLLLPVSLLPESSVSVMNAVPVAVSWVNPSAVAPDPPPVRVGPPLLQAATPTPTARLPLLPALWLGGAGLMGLWLLLSNLSFRKRLRRSAQRIKVNDYPLPVYATGAVPSPCLFGLFRPAVYLTADCLEDHTRLGHILTHEHTHYRHGDHLWSALRCVLLCLYWFDPFVWLAAALSRRDSELACDEGVLKVLGEGERLAYGRTILAMVAPAGAPRDLLCPATTMTSGARGLKERVALIARKPKMLAVTLAALVLIAAVAVVCTFTGARQAPVWERLLHVPEELDAVMVSSPQGVAYYYGADYASSGPYTGLLCDVSHVTAAEFEQSYPLWDMSGGFSPLGRDADGYYVLHSPTDVNSTHGAEYHATASTLRAWIDQIFSTQRDISSLKEATAYQSFRADCFFPGNHINAAYHPYDGTGETIDPVWTLLLSQPATQGEGGIWCVDRWYDGYGSAYWAVPQTELTMAEYYADLQSQADGGHRPGLLDPAEVSLAFVQAEFGHGHATAASFEVGQVYQGDPTAAQAGALRGEQERLKDLLAFQQRMLNLTAGGQVVLSLTGGDGITRDLTATVSEKNGQNYLDALLSHYTWTPVSAMPSAEPAGGYLTIYDAGRDACLRFDAQHPYAFFRENGIDHWYFLTPAGDQSEDTLPADAYHMARRWFDEVERAAIWPGLRTDSDDFQKIAGEWSNLLARMLVREITPGSVYEVRNAVCLGAQVYDTIPGDGTQFCAAITMAYDTETPNTSVWMAGSGLEEMTEGDYAGWWAETRQYKLVYNGDYWSMAEVGTGGVRLESP